MIESIALERDSEIKHEFDAGAIVAMSVGTARHSALAVNVSFAVRGTRRDGCTVFQSDMRVRVTATNRAMYPDVSTVCGAIGYDLEDAARTTITEYFEVREGIVTLATGPALDLSMLYAGLPV